MSYHKRKIVEISYDPTQIKYNTHSKFTIGSAEGNVIELEAFSDDDYDGDTTVCFTRESAKDIGEALIDFASDPSNFDE